METIRHMGHLEEYPHGYIEETANGTLLLVALGECICLQINSMRGPVNPNPIMARTGVEPQWRDESETANLFGACECGSGFPATVCTLCRDDNYA